MATMKIKIDTLPNGYSVTIDGKQMLYFNEQELLEGMFVHIGLQLGDYMNKQTIHDLMTACATWPEAKKGLVALKDIQEQNTALHNQIENLKNIIKRKEAYIEELKAAKSKANPKVMHRREAANDAPLMKMEQAARKNGLIK